MASAVALIYDEVFLKHKTGTHPENEERVRRVYDHLRGGPLYERLTEIPPRPATEEEILLVHSKQYYDAITSLPQDRMSFLDADTIAGPGSLEAALAAAGAVNVAVEAIKAGNVDRAFCLVRPPGHHALPDRAMGFCIFNNIAVGAAYATRRCGFDGAAIVDIDVHHGNGTQEVFYEDGEILYCSVHRWPFYPGTGRREEQGEGAGRGKTLNIPLPAGAGEASYLAALTEEILPAIRRHDPSIVFISAGFDTHRSDPIGGMGLTEASFATLTRHIADTASEVAGGRVISVLEGGYNLEALETSVQAHIEAMLE